jgi:predicted Zn-dependent protease with MMP-like domain
MGGLLARSKTIRWQKMLKEAIDKFPAKFTQLACRIILQLDPKVDVFSSESIDKMSK